MEVLEILESFESAAKFLGRDPELLPIVTGLPESDAKNIVSGFKLDVLSEAAWKASKEEIDWDNWDQSKYYPWWDMRKKVGSGVGLRFDDCVCAGEYSVVGSRRVFPSRKIAEFMAEKHFQLYVDVLVIPTKKKK